MALAPPSHPEKKESPIGFAYPPPLPLQPRGFAHLQQTNTLTEHESARTLCTEVKADGSEIASLHRRLSFRSYTVICYYSIPRGDYSASAYMIACILKKRVPWLSPPPSVLRLAPQEMSRDDGDHAEF